MRRQNWRINLILTFISLLGALLLGRLFYIQALRGDFYKALAQGLYQLNGKETYGRGEIFLKEGEPLAVNMEWSLAYASPREIKDKEKTSERLAEILNLDKNSLLVKLNQDNLYEVLKKRLNEEETQKIKELNLTGIYLRKETGRYYPQETLASQIAGFLDSDNKGQYGIEGYYDKILQGSRKTPGSDIVLTINLAIQFMAEKLLSDAQRNLDIESGEIIVINPNSGEIIALANFPNFNPNQYSKITDFHIFQNAATQKIFEPGSVFKPITFAAALEEEKITPQTTYIDEGQIKIDGWSKPIYNYANRVYGEQTMTNVLEKSINTGAVFAEKLLPHHVFLDYVEKFGIFELTGIDLEETCPPNKEFKEGREINFATASFGQGIEMTPIQLVRAYSAIANGGKLVKPYILKEIRDEDSVVEIKPKIEDDLVVSSKIATQLTSMLISVVENAFAKAAQIPGYYVAGKTGTAQISFAALDIAKSGYSDETWQTFVGFAPAFNPKFLILVKLDNPEAKTAEYSAVPIFHDLAKYIIDYYQIPPDYQE